MIGHDGYVAYLNLQNLQACIIKLLSAVAVKPPTLGGGYKATCTL